MCRAVSLNSCGRTGNLQRAPNGYSQAQKIRRIVRPTAASGHEVANSLHCMLPRSFWTQAVFRISWAQIIPVYGFNKKNELVMRAFNGDNPEHRNHCTISVRHPRDTICQPRPSGLFRGGERRPAEV